MILVARRRGDGVGRRRLGRARGEVKPCAFVGGLGYCEQVFESLHPAVRTWFDRRFPAGPTAPQAEGWREIAAGRHTLIAAPAGSGKALAAVPGCIHPVYPA